MPILNRTPDIGDMLKELRRRVRVLESVPQSVPPVQVQPGVVSYEQTDQPTGTRSGDLWIVPKEG